MALGALTVVSVRDAVGGGDARLLRHLLVHLHLLALQRLQLDLADRALVSFFLLVLILRQLKKRSGSMNPHVTKQTFLTSLKQSVSPQKICSGFCERLVFTDVLTPVHGERVFSLLILVVLHHIRVELEHLSSRYLSMYT